MYEILHMWALKLRNIAQFGFPPARHPCTLLHGWIDIPPCCISRSN
jgi:hypothetical protein